MFISLRNKNLITTRNACFSILLAGSSLACYGRNTTGHAKASGTCIVANTGPNARITQNCLVVNPELFKEFKAIAQGTRRNSAELKNVLDQLEAISKELEGGEKQQVITAPNGIAIGGGTVTNPTVNNNTYGAQQPPPHITWNTKPAKPGPTFIEGPTAANPGVEVQVIPDNTFVNPMFMVRCDRPCKGTAVHLNAAYGPSIYSTNSPNSALFSLGVTTGFIAPMTPVTLTVRSFDSNPISVITAAACIFSNNPGASPGSFMCSN